MASFKNMMRIAGRNTQADGDRIMNKYFLGRHLWDQSKYTEQEIGVAHPQAKKKDKRINDKV